MTGQSGSHIGYLPFTRTAGELQIALEHGGDAVHPSVSKASTTGEEPRQVLLFPEEKVRLPFAAIAQGFKPHVDDGREAVI